MDDHDYLLSIDDISLRLGIPVKTIRNKLSNGSWPVLPLRVGKALRWRASEVAKIVGGEIAIPARPGETGK